MAALRAYGGPDDARFWKWQVYHSPPDSSYTNNPTKHFNCELKDCIGRTHTPCPTLYARDCESPQVRVRARKTMGKEANCIHPNEGPLQPTAITWRSDRSCRDTSSP
ncbi:hypothetical protein AaE_004889 [Aphanomyces astaci]|uniref:Uncharacterized protein n=1 Tax=Aphanomyces astaci TaxID=112090 RepID=A0A6A5ANV5_APHAT|nr:hypothetical protein AaE_004889 [Aphanomyces astaci]